MELGETLTRVVAVLACLLFVVDIVADLLGSAWASAGPARLRPGYVLGVESLVFSFVWAVAGALVLGVGIGVVRAEAPNRVIDEAVAVAGGTVLAYVGFMVVVDGYLTVPSVVRSLSVALTDFVAPFLALVIAAFLLEGDDDRNVDRHSPGSEMERSDGRASEGFGDR